MRAYFMAQEQCDIGLCAGYYTMSYFRGFMPVSITPYARVFIHGSSWCLWWRLLPLRARNFGVLCVLWSVKVSYLRYNKAFRRAVTLPRIGNIAAAFDLTESSSTLCWMIFSQIEYLLHQKTPLTVMMIKESFFFLSYNLERWNSVREYT